MQQGFYVAGGEIAGYRAYQHAFFVGKDHYGEIHFTVKHGDGKVVEGMFGTLIFVSNIIKNDAVARGGVKTDHIKVFADIGRYDGVGKSGFFHHPAFHAPVGLQVNNGRTGLDDGMLTVLLLLLLLLLLRIGVAVVEKRFY
jgi:hypothetical protein